MKKNKNLIEELISQVGDLDIADLRDLADYCNDLADTLEELEDERE